MITYKNCGSFLWVSSCVDMKICGDVEIYATSIFVQALNESLSMGGGAACSLDPLEIPRLLPCLLLINSIVP